MKNRTKGIRILICFAAVMAAILLGGRMRSLEAAVTKPSAPKATGKASGSYVTLSWAKVSNADGFEILKYQAADRQFHWFKTIKTKKAVTLTLKGKTNCTYRYKIKSFKLVNGKKVYSSYASVKVKTAPSPGVVISSTSRDRTDSGVVRWRTNSHADGYEIYRAVSAAGAFTKVKTITGSATRTWRNSSLSQTRSYYYKVRAFCKNGSTITYSGFGGVKTIPAYQPPVTPTPTPLPEQPELDRRILLVGDSRMANMQGYLAIASLSQASVSNQNVAWLCNYGAKYSWLESVTGTITGMLDGRTDIYIWLGVNDAWDSTIYKKYVAYYQENVPKWRELGAKVFILGVGPIDGEDGPYNNASIETFNGRLREAILDGTIPGAAFIDLYSFIMSSGPGFEGDPYHYDRDTTIKIFYYILSVAAQS